MPYHPSRLTGRAAVAAERFDRAMRGVEKSIESPDPSAPAIAWLHLEGQRRSLEEQLKKVVSEQEKVRLRLLEAWSTDGISSENVYGTTIHLRRTLYPKVTNKAALAEALRQEGLTDLLTVNDKMLAAWVSAHAEAGTPLPDSVQALLGEQWERFAIVARARGNDH